MTPPAFLRGMRGKLIAIFVLIKVVPLLLLAGFAWNAASRLGGEVSDKAGHMAEAMRATIGHVGKTVIDDSIRALDLRSREAIEALTVDTAKEIADFLYDRDRDVRLAARQELSEAAFRRFLADHTRRLHKHGEWRLRADGQGWEPVETVPREAKLTSPILNDNAKDFHIRAAEYLGESEDRPLFVEMTFVTPDGQEKIKVTSGSLTEKTPKNVVDRKNTFLGAETYFPELKKLKPGEIHVSEVIGAYVPTHAIGAYTPERLAKAGKDFKPEESAYAGTENPVGKRFRGIVRWATPVLQNGRIAGYVTLALDHDHIRQFSDRLMPTEQRYTPISDASNGNYAFIWDHKSRAISHPRDYFIVGYDPASGRPATPWMDEELHGEWQRSGLPVDEFLAGIPAFRDQNLQRKPASALTAAGTVGLDCRYLNFSPQCHGWNALTEHGGSGSFVIFFSGLWKLTTAAAIPYHTGQYARSPQGFGFVTIGANVDEFHKAASETADRINRLLGEKDAEFKAEREGLLGEIADSLRSTAFGLWGSTLVMVIAVIAIAIWMADLITGRITRMIAGIHAFQRGERGERLTAESSDEMGELAHSFNRMADSVEESFTRLEEARSKAEEASQLKSAFLATISHELRTPLNGIIGFADLLHSELQDPEQAEYARIIQSSGEKLLGQVNDILDLTRIQSGEVAPNSEIIELASLIADAVERQRQPLAEKKLAVELKGLDTPLPVLRSDPLRIRQILDRLLDNAVKFTPSGSISILLEGDSREIRIAIRDTGPGIPLESQEAVFEKFKQLEHFLTRHHGGIGLGLALSQQLAALLGGHISLQSEAGQGACFTLHLPLTPEAHDA
ncbi:MAG: HAMP domain-containing histidine kinase [Azonexus sp.]|nr:HAMP domain-containing sensor histidine kinase [Azonexus sp.]MCK6411222.1 HAMP domain-containing histidine kinase [Azonexus sp.]